MNFIDFYEKICYNFTFRMVYKRYTKGGIFTEKKEKNDGFWDLANLQSPATSEPRHQRAASLVRPEKPASVDRKAEQSFAFSGDDAVREISLSTTKAESEGATVARSHCEPMRENPHPHSSMPDGTTVCTYEGSGLIKTVKISRWPSKYSFYEQFLRYARDFFDICYGESEYVPFFSFMPQYQQMSRSQLHYYMWWRENLRKGICLQTDQCYLLLLIYEILNLPDRLPPKEGARLLAFLWAAYRDRFPKLDRYLAEWLPDYCLIHRQPCPLDLLSPFLSAILPHTTLKEFYLGKGGDGAMEGVLSLAMLELSVGYQYRRSKYLNDENKEVFHRHIPSAMQVFLTGLRHTDSRFSQHLQSEPVMAVRDSYVGAICALRFKRRIEVTYFPATKIGQLSEILTDAVKYCENAVRSSLGIRSRFRVTHLTEDMKALLDGYFAQHLPSATVRKEKPSDFLSNESAYEPLSRGFSTDDARRIEADSRKAVELLAPFEEEEKSESRQEAGEVAFWQTVCQEKAEEAPQKDDTEGEILRRALLFLYTDDGEGFRALAKRCNKMEAALAEQVNAAALERYGDIAAEEQEGRYHLIEDYREDVKEWLNL